MVVVDMTVVVDVIVMVPSPADTTTELEDPLSVSEEIVLLFMIFFVELSLSK